MDISDRKHATTLELPEVTEHDRALATRACRREPDAEVLLDMLGLEG